MRIGFFQSQDPQGCYRLVPGRTHRASAQSFRDSVVSPVEEAGSALASQRDVSLPDRTDGTAEESLNSCTFGELLAGHVEENAEEFKYFKTLVLTPDMTWSLECLLC